MEVRTVYLKSVFEPLLFQETFDRTLTAARLLRSETEFDTIAFSGTSGAAMAWVLGLTMRLPVLCVRKQVDDAHYRGYKSSPLEGNVGTQRYLVVDDFISSGRTINYIISSICKEVPHAECSGILLYADPYSPMVHKHPNKETSIKIVSCRSGEE